MIPPFTIRLTVFDAVVDAVPLLTRGKADVVLFFRGCGITGLQRRIGDDPTFSKYHITREVLTHVNDLGDAGLPQRRQILKRVSEFDEFSSCYPNNQLKERGAVANVAQLINKKDSFTRLSDAREQELRRHREAQQTEADAKAAQRAERERIRDDLFALFGETNAHRRGKALEGVLNRLFASGGMLLREAFVVNHPDGTSGTIEQVDGAIELDGRVYLVEMKWWDRPLGRAEVSSQLVSVYGRGEVGGIFISQSGYYPSAVAEYKTALAQRTVAWSSCKRSCRRSTPTCPCTISSPRSFMLRRSRRTHWSIRSRTAPGPDHADVTGPGGNPRHPTNSSRTWYATGSSTLQKGVRNLHSAVRRLRAAHPDRPAPAARRVSDYPLQVNKVRSHREPVTSEVRAEPAPNWGIRHIT